MTPKLKKIILTILIVIILFVVYAVFIKPDPTQENLVSNGGSQTSEDVKILANQITQALLKIEQIKLDRTIFSSEIYQSLEDRSREIEEEPIGRSNPFAPLGDISVSSSVRIPSTTTGVSTSTKTQSTTNSTSTTSAGGALN